MTPKLSKNQKSELKAMQNKSCSTTLVDTKTVLLSYCLSLGLSVCLSCLSILQSFDMKVGGWEKLRIKSISAQLKLQLGLSLAKHYIEKNKSY